MTELGAPKTYKLYSGGAFIRSESGRVYPVAGVDGGTVRVAQASRKDLRDAVVKARAAQSGWGAATPYLRGQILYRIAEMLDGRRDQFVAELENGGVDTYDAAVEVDDAVDTWVYWAGWTDKLTQVLGGVNPVAGPFLNVSTPEPTGVVGVDRSGRAPPRRFVGPPGARVVRRQHRSGARLGGVALRAAHLRRGAGHVRRSGGGRQPARRPGRRAGAVVGRPSRCRRARHLGCRGRRARLDLTVRSADNLKRVARTDGVRSPRTAGEFLEIKTVWHPARL
ncbi:MAG: aldehyde dehydrogenase family protein [Microthrixaceae bacterium]